MSIMLFLLSTINKFKINKCFISNPIFTIENKILKRGWINWINSIELDSLSCGFLVSSDRYTRTGNILARILSHITAGYVTKADNERYCHLRATLGRPLPCHLLWDLKFSCFAICLGFSLFQLILFIYLEFCEDQKSV